MARSRSKCEGKRNSVEIFSDHCGILYKTKKSDLYHISYNKTNSEYSNDWIDHIRWSSSLRNRLELGIWVKDDSKMMTSGRVVSSRGKASPRFGQTLENSKVRKKRKEVDYWVLQRFWSESWNSGRMKKKNEEAGSTFSLSQSSLYRKGSLKLQMSFAGSSRDLHRDVELSGRCNRLWGLESFSHLDFPPREDDWLGDILERHRLSSGFGAAASST